MTQTDSERYRQGYADQAAWLQGKPEAEARHALASRLATQESGDYNDGATQATRDYLGAAELCPECHKIGDHRSTCSRKGQRS